jgi:vacuolar-type H+-ATPase subunit I/STV1
MPAKSRKRGNKYAKPSLDEVATHQATEEDEARKAVEDAAVNAIVESTRQAIEDEARRKAMEEEEARKKIAEEILNATAVVEKTKQCRKRCKASAVSSKVSIYSQLFSYFHI